jgi:hypothetical protein
VDKVIESNYYGILEAGFKGLTAMAMKNSMYPLECSPVKVNRRFGENIASIFRAKE